MNRTATTETTGTRPVRRILRRSILAALLIPVVAVALAGPAAAETDGLSDQCIYTNNVKRACAENLYVTWGSGISWRVGGSLYDERADGSTNTVEVKLDRQLISDTGWMQVLRVGDFQSHRSSISGYDPTNGAWIRLCTTSSSGVKSCLSGRYVRDDT